MPIDQADIINLAHSYSRSGLHERRAYLQGSPESAFTQKLRASLDHLDRLIALNLDQAVCDSDEPDVADDPATPLMQSALREYSEAIKSLHREEINPQPRDLFVRTGRYLYDEVEPLLGSEAKQALARELKTLHNSIASENYPDWVFTQPKLRLGAKCPHGLAELVGQPSFQDAFAARLAVRLKELLSGLFDNGISMPRSIELSFDKTRCRTVFNCGEASGQKMPDRNLQQRFQENFVDAIHHTILHLLKKNDAAIDINKALDQGWFNTEITAYSAESQEADRKRALEMEEDLRRYKLGNLQKKLNIEGVQVDRPGYLSCNLIQALFREIEADLKAWIRDLKTGILHPDESYNYAATIKRASLLIEDFANCHNQDPGFKKVWKRYKAINERVAAFIEKYLLRELTATKEFTNDTFRRMVDFVRVENLGASQLYDSDELNQQLATLLDYQEVLEDNQHWFEALAANACYSLVNELLVAIDPLDLRGLSALEFRVNIDQDAKGNNYPALTLVPYFMMDDPDYDDYFCGKYQDLINDAVDEANISLRTNFDDNYILNWNNLQSGTQLAMGFELDLRSFSRARPVAEFSMN